MHFEAFSKLLSFPCLQLVDEMMSEGSPREVIGGQADSSEDNALSEYKIVGDGH